MVAVSFGAASPADLAACVGAGDARRVVAKGGDQRLQLALGEHAVRPRTPSRAVEHERGLGRRLQL